MFKGRRYRISCDDLSAPRNKEGSYSAANRWWTEKRKNLDAAASKSEHQGAIEDLDRKISYARTHEPEALPNLEELRKKTSVLKPFEDPELPDAESIQRNVAAARLFGITIPPDLDQVVLQHFFGDRRVWNDRMKRTPSISPDKTFARNLEDFLKESKPSQEPATYSELSRNLKKLFEGKDKFLEPTADISCINESLVSRHSQWLHSRNLDSTTHNKYLGFFRRFVVWLFQTKRIDQLPRNLDSKTHGKKKQHKAVAVYQGVREVLRKLPEKQRLWALLCLNCGMTNVDLGGLEWADITKEGEIWILCRRRVKTGKNPKIPTVRYKLWEEVIDLLANIKPENPVGHIFTMRNGKPLYRHTFNEEGIATKYDGFGVCWKRMKNKPEIPLAKFRSIAATELKKDHRDLVSYYLGHAPTTVADKHYAAESDGPFFEALDKLHQRIFRD